MAVCRDPPFKGFPMTSAPQANTSLGRLAGAVEQGVCVFRGVPYAQDPVGALSFAPPTPLTPWSGVRDASHNGPIPPQPPSRLRAAMGDFDEPQGEDCLTLTIATPAADGARRPVLLWLHGGAFWTGAGSLDWYSGVPMAQHNDMVVVGVNHRLGALGFMHLPGVSPPNLGLMDQCAALEWVAREIAAFGGDPDNITVAGQSAGGLSILAMLAMPQVRQHFRRCVIQSAPFGRTLREMPQAERIALSVQKHLGITDAAQWRDASVQDIGQAQVKAARELAAFANTTPPFIPVIDHQWLGDETIAAATAGAADKDVMVGYTRHEMAAFFGNDEAIQNATPEQVRAVFATKFGAAADEAVAEYQQRAGSDHAAQVLGCMLGDASFGTGVYQFAERLHATGRGAWVYRFDWTAPGNRFGACHCIELPFMFDTLAHWQAPMLEGADVHEKSTVAANVRNTWAAFARHGDPNHTGLPHWPRHAAKGETLLINHPPSVHNDPAGRQRWKYWP